MLLLSLYIDAAAVVLASIFLMFHSFGVEISILFDVPFVCASFERLLLAAYFIFMVHLRLNVNRSLSLRALLYSGVLLNVNK